MKMSLKCCGVVRLRSPGRDERFIWYPGRSQPVIRTDRPLKPGKECSSPFSGWLPFIQLGRRLRKVFWGSAEHQPRTLGAATVPSYASASWQVVRPRCECPPVPPLSAASARLDSSPSNARSISPCELRVGGPATSAGTERSARHLGATTGRTPCTFFELRTVTAPTTLSYSTLSADTAGRAR
jgi:hypothetical protein